MKEERKGKGMENEEGRKKEQYWEIGECCLCTNRMGEGGWDAHIIQRFLRIEVVEMEQHLFHTTVISHGSSSTLAIYLFIMYLKINQPKY